MPSPRVHPDCVGHTLLLERPRMRFEARGWSNPSFSARFFDMNIWPTTLSFARTIHVVSTFGMDIWFAMVGHAHRLLEARKCSGARADADSSFPYWSFWVTASEERHPLELLPSTYLGLLCSGYSSVCPTSPPALSRQIIDFRTHKWILGTDCGYSTVQYTAAQPCKTT